MTHQTDIPRVALVASSLVQAGAEKQFVYTARALLKAGVDARVFYLGSGGYYERILREAGVALHQIDCPGRPFSILFGLIRAFQQFRPHIVVASQFGDIPHAALAGRLVRAVVVGGVRSNGLLDLEMHGRRSRAMLRLPHLLVANSQCARKNLISQGVNPRRIHVLSNVIDLRDFDQRSLQPVSIPFEPSMTVVAAVGRVDRNKRFDRLVESLGRTRNTAPSLAGLIVGRDLGERSSLVEQAKTLGVFPDNLAFMGASDHVPSVLARVHMLVVTSDSEGFPNVLLEAMAARLPVITTPAGDGPAIVGEARAGYVVNFDDVSGMAELMVHLAESPSLRAEFGECGRQQVEREYDFESFPGRLLATYQRATTGRRLCWPKLDSGKHSVPRGTATASAV
jgi:glycosyltransferase involved in cell wall biosynthesis